MAGGGEERGATDGRGAGWWAGVGPLRALQFARAGADAFVAGQLQAPKKLASRVHDHYFHPKHPEFEPRTMWSLSNAFTSAFGELDPVPRFRATAKLAPFLARYD